MTGRAWRLAAATPDPELPELTVADLGILRDVTESDDLVQVTVTPTYSGCPALAAIVADIRRRLAAAGYPRVEIHTQLAPAWTSDWITADGRRKLERAGIAGPTARRQTEDLVMIGEPRHAVACPRCGEPGTESLSEFGATPCRSLRRCPSCREPFEHIKAH